MPLYLGIVVKNRVETLHATNATNVTTDVLVGSVRVVCEFARVRVRVCVAWVQQEASYFFFDFVTSW